MREWDGVRDQPLLTTTRRYYGRVSKVRIVTRVVQTLVFDVFSRCVESIVGGKLKPVKTTSSTAADITTLIAVDWATR